MRFLLNISASFVALGAVSLFAQPVHRVPTYRTPVRPHTPPQVRMPVDPRAIPSPPEGETRHVGSPVLAPQPDATTMPVDIGDALAAQPPRPGTKRPLPVVPDPSDGNSSPSPIDSGLDALNAPDGIPKKEPQPPAMPPAPGKIEGTLSLSQAAMREQAAFAPVGKKRQIFNENLAKLAKLNIEQKDLAATLALTKKIDDPAMRAKTLTELAEYIAHDPAFKSEAAILLAAATKATLALGGLKMSDLPELADPATAPVSAPTSLPTAPLTGSASVPITVPRPTPPPATAPLDISTLHDTNSPKPDVPPRPVSPAPIKPAPLLPAPPAPASETLDSELPDTLELDDAPLPDFPPSKTLEQTEMPQRVVPTAPASPGSSGILPPLGETDEEEVVPARPIAEPPKSAPSRPVPRPTRPSTATPSTRPPRSVIPTVPRRPAPEMDAPISSSPLDEDEELDAPGSK